MTLEEFYKEWNNDNNEILVHTSGSTGKPKSMMVEKCRMLASAKVTCDFLGLKPGDSTLLCMPLDYIAGKMVVVRAIEHGLRLITVKPSGRPLKDLKESPQFAAMVPLQVFNSLQYEHDTNILVNIKHLIIGGGIIDAELENRLRNFPNAVWSTYGMTETLSHIAIRRVSGEAFSNFYTLMKGVEISQDKDGCAVIYAPAVCNDRLYTNDIISFSDDKSGFLIIGRRDNVIDTGGIKVQIEELEQSIKPFVDFRFAITKKSDPKFGETIVMVIENGFSNSEDSIKTISSEVSDKLLNMLSKHIQKFKLPRIYYTINHIPLTGTGKIARKKLEQIIANVSESNSI